ncbi:hypothetical protein [Paenibacillus sinopodophylli]|uniref:hypothetical protein n=1 Tax=Paenibacillus sinopodophylli TaxID=1837342 RepID=UPI00110CDF73|nr:hypothetical protein [Paenibacillus sinopodophylli]
MGKSFGVVNLIALLFFAALLVGYMNYIGKEKEEIERLKLSYAIDYSADAGTAAMLGTSDLDMDYTKDKFFSVDPQLALDTFLDVFCFNYDLHPTEQNRAYIKDFIPVAAVAAQDGYYIASPQIVRNQNGLYPETPANDSYWDLVFGMKLPYSYEYEEVSYALNMGMTETLAISGNQLYKHQGLPPTDSGIMSITNAREIINQTVSNEMASRIDQLNEVNPNWKNFFYIPNQLTTFSGVNPIESPSFLILVQGVTLNTTRPISGFSISGTSIDRVRMVAGYIRFGVKYYTYVDLVPAGIEVDEFFDTFNEAAKADYYPDLRTFEK